MEINPLEAFDLRRVGQPISRDQVRDSPIPVIEDRVELGEETPKQFVQVLDDKVEIIGNRKQRTEVIETRTELDGEVLKADIQTVIEELPLEPFEAQNAHGSLDPDRLRSLLFGD